MSLVAPRRSIPPQPGRDVIDQPLTGVCALQVLAVSSRGQRREPFQGVSCSSLAIVLGSDKSCAAHHAW